MAAIRIEATLEGVDKAITALGGVSLDAERAQRTAMRSTVRRAQSLGVKAVAKRVGVIQKVIRGRVQAFARPNKNERIARGRLWMGIKFKPRHNEHPSVARKLKSLYPNGHLRVMASGRTAWVERIGGRLTERRIDLRPGEVDPILKRTATQAMRDVYGPELRKDFGRRVKRRAGLSTGGRSRRGR